MMIKVSIVVPIFNTEKYIEKCLKSLVNQTLQEIEIICVNDGSTDRSMEIVEQFAVKDSRIKIINQPNLKQGAARNNGTKVAQGEYIGYVDSDDWVDIDYFEKLYNAAKKYNSDLALATNVRIGNGKTKKRLELTREEYIVDLQGKMDVCRQWKDGCPTNKLYRRIFLQEKAISFEEGVGCEDKLFTTQAVYYANGIVTVPNIYYYYFRNPDSTVKTCRRFWIKNDDKENARRSVLKFLKEHNAPLRDKDFWAVKRELRFLGIPLFTIKESLMTQKTLVLGVPVFEIEETEKYKNQVFVGGLVVTKKLKSEIKEQKLFKVFGIPVSERVIENDICKYYCFGCVIKRFYLADKLFKDVLSKINFDYDDVYFLHSNSGEISLFFAYLASAFFKKNGSKKPLFVATKQCQVEILKMYFPDAQYIVNDKLKIKTQGNHWTISGHHIYIIFSSNHFYKVESDIKNNEINAIHYLNSMLTTLGLTENDYNDPSPVITEGTKESLLSKTKKIHLNLDNFIIIAPEAKTYNELPVDFWNKLAGILHQKGYEIFVNSTNSDIKITSCKTIPLSHQELFCLARDAKAIISLRSGLSEFLLPTNIPNIAIYTNFRKKNIRNSFSNKKNIAGFSMLKIPYISSDKIAEINAEEYFNVDTLLNKVLESFDSMLNNEENLV